jgi:leucyl/phenylalanyl-tRNA---protein transferase
MPSNPSHLPFLKPGQAFPPVAQAWGTNSPAPGLLAGGGQLDVLTLQDAYQNGIFPWFSEGQPVLWWSPDPRMILHVANFKLHRSLKQALYKFKQNPHCEIRMNTVFERVIEACAQSARQGSPGTWILPDMVDAYVALHHAGLAHSVETWIDGTLAGGLYCVGIGKAVFGESMFTTVPNASKIALAALVCFCRIHCIEGIDCQQNTRHLASLGAREIDRATFLAQVKNGLNEPSPHWNFSPLYWHELLSPTTTTK